MSTNDLLLNDRALVLSEEPIQYHNLQYMYNNILQQGTYT
jgi:hypothetical protein